MKKPKIFPILLAAGRSAPLRFPKPLAGLGGKNALEIAAKNCSGLEKPIMVLGNRAAELRASVPRGVQVVINRRWRSGQLSSLAKGLRLVPRSGAFMIYPVDHVFLTPRLVRSLVNAFQRKVNRHKIIMPRCRRRAGHPVIFPPELRHEVLSARTAREVVYRDPSRIQYVQVISAAIWLELDTPAHPPASPKKLRPRIR